MIQQKSIELNEDFVKGHFRKGLSLLELNRPEEAMMALTQAHDLAPKDEEIFSTLNKAKTIANKLIS